MLLVLIFLVSYYIEQNKPKNLCFSTGLLSSPRQRLLREGETLDDAVKLELPMDLQAQDFE